MHNGDPAKWCVRADFCMTNFDKTDKLSQYYGVFSRVDMGRQSELHPAGVLSGVTGADKFWLNKTASRRPEKKKV
jgi:hypothetical protein